MTATATAATTDLQTLDMAEIELREVNAALQGAPATNYTQFEIRNPRGSHAVAVGLDAGHAAATSPRATPQLQQHSICGGRDEVSPRGKHEGLSALSFEAAAPNRTRRQASARRESTANCPGLAKPAVMSIHLSLC